MKRILRVDVSKRTVCEEVVSEDLSMLAGRGLIAKLLLDEVDPTCDPLGRGNKLIIAPGLLGGTSAPNAQRISMGGKSPLTGGIKESNGGGLTAIRLAKLGIKAVIIEGMPENGSLCNLVINSDGVQLVEADHLKGVGIYKSTKWLHEKYGTKAALAVIGPAGENCLLSACIGNTDPDGNPTRYCGRGGMGALMGAKGIKAIVVENSRDSAIAYADKKMFSNVVKEIMECVKKAPDASKMYPKYGTPLMIGIMNEKGALPTRNFTNGQFELVENITGERMYDVIEERKGEGRHKHTCMPGCVIGCSNIYPDKNGKKLVAPLEFETIGMLGSNCGIGDLDEIAHLNYLCNDYGIDTIETGCALGVAMEKGLAGFGDAKGAEALIREIGKASVVGRVLGSGVVTTGKVLGSSRIPAVKGQGFPAYDVRAARTCGVLFSTSPMGADHTGGHGMRSALDQLKPEGHVEFSRKLQIITSAFDCLGFCIMISSSIGGRPDLIVSLINARYGTDVGEDFVTQLGTGTLKTEREFNKLAGFTKVDDRVPEFFKQERVPPHNLLFDVSDEEIDTFFNFE
ncbi:MAG: aldehyde ferredoxin oxidoreductase [Spirochaetes bacterium]|nr:aldehyde ferredoxin oxidoreductase [Spirochaetota bacterium]